MTDDATRKELEDKTKIVMAAIREQFPGKAVILVVEDCLNGAPLVTTSQAPSEAAITMLELSVAMSRATNLDESVGHVYLGENSDETH